MTPNAQVYTAHNPDQERTLPTLPAAPFLNSDAYELAAAKAKMEAAHAPRIGKNAGKGFLWAVLFEAAIFTTLFSLFRLFVWLSSRGIL